MNSEERLTNFEGWERHCNYCARFLGFLRRQVQNIGRKLFLLRDKAHPSGVECL